MADLDMDAIQARAHAVTDRNFPSVIRLAREDVPALIARVRELEAALNLAVGTNVALLTDDDLDALDDDERSGRRRLGGLPFTIADARKILAALKPSAAKTEEDEPDEGCARCGHHRDSHRSERERVNPSHVCGQCGCVDFVPSAAKEPT